MGRSQQRLTNLTTGGPVHVDVRDGTIVRIVPLQLDDSDAPSNARALQRFERAAQRHGFAVEQISRDDFGRLAEFDALFIRETTSVNHHTYRFARRAEAEGLVVIDDPESILKCTNKVFLAEILERHKVPTPRTLVVHRGNRSQIAGDSSQIGGAKGGSTSFYSSATRVFP